MLDLNGIDLHFGHHTVLSKVALSVTSREIITIVGPSGCGKTVLLLVIGGLLQPSAGERVLGDSLTEKDVVYVPQQDALLPWRSLRANIGLGRELRGAGAPPTVVIDKWAKVFNSTQFLEKRVQEISGGMRKRICLTRAFCAEPSLILLDEPFNNLDFSDRHRVEMFLRSWVGEDSRAVVCVTHDIDQAVAIGDRIGCFKKPDGDLGVGAMQFDVVLVPDSLRKQAPSERRLNPEFFDFVSKIERSFDHG